MKPTPVALASLLVGLPVGLPAQHRHEPPAAPPESAAEAESEDAMGVWRVPTPDRGLDTMGQRRSDEVAALQRAGLRPAFRFADATAASGIDFLHRPTEDSGRAYKAVHYDHGNGIAAADVDGDGRIDLYFVNQLGANELWQNLGGGRFRDITEQAGVGLADRVGVTASFGDLDNDGDPDLFVTTVRGGNALFENLGEGRFRDVTSTAGVGHVGHSSAAVLLDFDRDGRLDIFVTNVGSYTIDRQGPEGYWIGREDAFSGHLFPERTERSLLYRNLGGLRFEEVGEATGLNEPGWNGDASFTDLDRDGYPELYVLDMQGDDSYWDNRGGTRFVERTAELFPKTPWGAMGIKFFDVDGDRRLDLILTDMHSDMTQEVGYEKERQKSEMKTTDEALQGGANNLFGNALYLAQPDGSFREASDELGVETYWPWGVSVADVDADGWQDVLVTNSMSFPFHYQTNALLLNHRGQRFVEATFATGLEPRDPTHVPWVVMECGGADAAHPACRGRRGRVQVLGSVGTRATVFADLDDDGDLDLVLGEFGAPAVVLNNDLADRDELSYLKVSLVGSRSNRDGLGAFVTVDIGERQLLQFHDGKSGYLSQSSLPLYFGLGGSAAVERVVVRWPSGVEQTLPGPIEPNQSLVIREPPAPDAEAPEAESTAPSPDGAAED